MKKVILAMICAIVCVTITARSIQATPYITKSHYQNDSLFNLTRKRQVVRGIIEYLVREHIVQDRSVISYFLLTDTAMVVNGQKLPAPRHIRLIQDFLPGPGFTVYYGNQPMPGKGIFLRTDNL